MAWYHKVAARRAPDFIIGGKDTPYMLRWWIIPRNKWFNIYLSQVYSIRRRPRSARPPVGKSIIPAGRRVRRTRDFGWRRQSINPVQGRKHEAAEGRSRTSDRNRSAVLELVHYRPRHSPMGVPLPRRLAALEDIYR